MIFWTDGKPGNETEAKMKRLICGTALAALMTSTAAAETLKVGDLGEMPSRRVCMAIAAEVLETYIKEFGGLSTSGDANDPGSWSYYAWDLRPGDIDMVITCPVVASQVNAFYTIHSAGDEEAEANIAGDRIRKLWDQLY
jgi:hypothetical protein